MTRRRYRRPADRRAHGHLYGHGHGYGVGGGMTVRHPHRAVRHDRRRERRMRRRHGRGGPPVLVILLGAVVGLLLVAGLAIRLAFVIVEALLPVLVIAAIGVLLFMALRRTKGRREPGPVAPSAAVPAPVAWDEAKTRFDAVRAEYSAHECDPMAVLRRPALSDVSVASTARFVDAFAEAQALDTDTHPGEPHDARYVAAVERAARAWQAAQDAADRIRLTGLTPDERASVERVLKLLTTARDSDSEPERLAAYARARTELDRLDRAGVVHLPRTARAAIDEASRGALPG